MTAPRPQMRTRIIHAAHIELEAIVAEGRSVLAGHHDGLTEALADLIARVALVSRTLAGPAPTSSTPRSR